MRGRPRGYRLSWKDWPFADRTAWQAAFEPDDWLEDERQGAALSEATRRWLKSDYASWLGFLALHDAELLKLAPRDRVGQATVSAYMEFVRANRIAETTVVMLLRGLATVLYRLAPDVDWNWIRETSNRLATKARPRPKPWIASDALSALGYRLMRTATDTADAASIVTAQTAAKYRDGLLIAFLAAIPLRRGSLAEMQINEHLLRAGATWRVPIPAHHTKTRRKLDYVLAPPLSQAVDQFIARFRPRIYRSAMHRGVWPSRQGIPLKGISIYAIITKRTKAEFGVAVSPHRFRHAAATYLAVRDPANVRMAKDLLGHTSFTTTDTYYLIAQSRIAGKALARAIRSQASSREDSLARLR